MVMNIKNQKNKKYKYKNNLTKISIDASMKFTLDILKKKRN